MLDAKSRRDALDKAITELAATPPYLDVVGRLVCLRGVSTLTAFALKRARAVFVDQYRIGLLDRLGCSSQVAMRVRLSLG
jgi:hypothetical protein